MTKAPRYMRNIARKMDEQQKPKRRDVALELLLRHPKTKRTVRVMSIGDRTSLCAIGALVRDAAIDLWADDEKEAQQ